MRLVNLTISHPVATDTTIWNVKVIVAYGDDDLLCSPSVVGSCSSNATMSPASNFKNTDLVCKATTGSQFCDVATLSTTVKRRVKDAGS
jgi:hypothetical protein